MANTPNSETTKIGLEVINATVSSSDTNPGGYVGFYGTTPVAQRASSVQYTSASGSMSATAYVASVLVEIMNTLAGVGLWKGGA